jgi:ankyrin repeat protein
MTFNSRIARGVGFCCLFLVIGGGTVRTGYGRHQQSIRNAALFEAAMRNDLPKVQILLAQGASPNARWQDNKSMTMLDFCKQVTGIDRRAGERSEPALMVVAASGNLALARTLVDAGADVNIRDAAGFSPILWASNGHQQESGAIILFLAEHGADLNAKTEDGSTVWKLANSDPKTLIALHEAAARK